MPELPEVETIRRTLRRRLYGKIIWEVWIKKDSRLLRDTVAATTIKTRLQGKKILALERRGKYLIFTLSSRDRLVIHLGMTGNLFLIRHSQPSPKHTHLRLGLGEEDLILIDPRTFGRLFLIKDQELASHPVLSRLGPEPFSSTCSVPLLRQKFSRRRSPLKAALLDQSVIAGLGNIYADEACFLAGISPLRQADSLSEKEVVSLHRAIRQVLRAAIQAKGTTISDYHPEAGKTGGFQKRLKVYGKAGEKCPRCGAQIHRHLVAGRSACFCPCCQK